jgi:hypothetical protein
MMEGTYKEVCVKQHQRNCCMDGLVGHLTLKMHNISKKGLHINLKFKCIEQPFRVFSDEMRKIS